jgi:hypothetical protein
MLHAVMSRLVIHKLDNEFSKQEQTSMIEVKLFDEKKSVRVNCS